MIVPNKTAVLIWATSPDDLHTSIIKCNGCAAAEKIAVKNAYEHLVRLGHSSGIIYTDHQAILTKTEIPVTFELRWI